MRCVYDSIDSAQSCCMTCVTPGTSMPRSATLVATSICASPSRNACMARSRFCCDMPECSTAQRQCARSGSWRNSDVRPLASLSQPFLRLTKMMMGGGGPSRSSSSTLSRRCLSLSTHTTSWRMRFTVPPTSPITTVAGRRRYLRERRSTAGGMVAEKRLVVRNMCAPAEPAAMRSCSCALASSMSFHCVVGMKSSIFSTCSSKPIDTMRSASSSTMNVHWLSTR
mmetsp:Transcript_20404/g.49988  ORF Transcript_20404/g.49988 Transcript_20404/m.49988 type:complete len:225 (-) Transcript_20404:517-1191(-)